MNLWIRSQNKMSLVKVSQINVNYQNNNQIIANYIPDFVGTQGEYYELLGTYKTKERALEVLDEINDYKDEFEKSYFLGMTESNFVSSTFEMPKE